MILYSWVISVRTTTNQPGRLAYQTLGADFFVQHLKNKWNASRWIKDLVHLGRITLGATKLKGLSLWHVFAMRQIFAWHWNSIAQVAMQKTRFMVMKTECNHSNMISRTTSACTSFFHATLNSKVPLDVEHSHGRMAAGTNTSLSGASK